MDRKDQQVASSCVYVCLCALYRKRRPSCGRTLRKREKAITNYCARPRSTNGHYVAALPKDSQVFSRPLSFSSLYTSILLRLRLLFLLLTIQRRDSSIYNARITISLLSRLSRQYKHKRYIPRLFNLSRYDAPCKTCRLEYSLLLQ